MKYIWSKKPTQARVLVQGLGFSSLLPFYTSPEPKRCTKNILLQHECLLEAISFQRCLWLKEINSNAEKSFSFVVAFFPFNKIITNVPDTVNVSNWIG